MKWEKDSSVLHHVLVALALICLVPLAFGTIIFTDKNASAASGQAIGVPLTNNATGTGPELVAFTINNDSVLTNRTTIFLGWSNSGTVYPLTRIAETDTNSGFHISIWHLDNPVGGAGRLVGTNGGIASLTALGGMFFTGDSITLDAFNTQIDASGTAHSIQITNANANSLIVSACNKPSISGTVSWYPGQVSNFNQAVSASVWASSTRQTNTPSGTNYDGYTFSSSAAALLGSASFYENTGTPPATTNNPPLNNGLLLRGFQ